ncbi:MAG: cytochrome c [Gammaproteobacteria bacterium]|jgi:mono/diheme cytochrome c family protein|nr:cytochrome c [Gammaproteobacteria bacterium]MBT3488798.1 cytochrome c [Gammaproteobacteria bacterium]MBT3719125.1 cytochrome c [Gammaproteobacteria bacterium]MBT3843541.1 cytochrome c [Gammaproteobacteria bacterium]MBT3892759.1 cytochrome c [Gammaproteobacteria bacterium]
MGIKTVIGMAGLGIAGGVAFILSGAFNVSATDRHWDITTSLLELVRERSVEVRSKDIQDPPLGDLQMVSNGAKNYAAMCAQCHLAPGMEPTELNQGLYPQPPVFHQQREKHDKYDKHDPAETFWAIKHGFKMTGMPAWGEFHTDEQLWELVAFLDVVEGMRPEYYQGLVGEGGHTHVQNDQDAVPHIDSHN